MYKGYCVQLDDGAFVGKDGLLYSVPILGKILVDDLPWVTKHILESAKESYPLNNPKIVKVNVGFTIGESLDD